MTSLPTHLTKLEKMAREAIGPAEPWRTVLGDSVVNVVSADGYPITATTTKAYFEKFDDTDLAIASLIAAANPTIILALVEVARWAERALHDANYNDDLSRALDALHSRMKGEG